jgi:AcrR family transcriptional regulator
MAQKTRNYHHGDLKTAMIEAALTLVRENGPRGFTLNEASRRAGVSASAPYNHFKDKDGLLVEIAIRGNRTLEKELRSAAESDGTAKEKLLSVYLAYLAFAQKHPDLFSVMFLSGVDKDPYPEVNESARNAFEVALNLAMKVEKEPKNGQELAMAIWTMAHGFAMLEAESILGRATGIRVTKELARHLAQRLL